MARQAEAEWKGDLKGGSGRVKLGSGAYEGNYSFATRFENGAGANPDVGRRSAEVHRASIAARHRVALLEGDLGARAMGDAPDFIKQRHVDNCRKADRAYGAGVEAALRKLGAFAGTNRRSEE